MTRLPIPDLGILGSAAAYAGREDYRRQREKERLALMEEERRRMALMAEVENNRMDSLFDFADLQRKREQTYLQTQFGYDELSNRNALAAFGFLGGMQQDEQRYQQMQKRDSALMLEQEVQQRIRLGIDEKLNPEGRTQHASMMGKLQAIKKVDMPAGDYERLMRQWLAEYDTQQIPAKVVKPPTIQEQLAQNVHIADTITDSTTGKSIPLGKPTAFTLNRSGAMTTLDLPDSGEEEAVKRALLQMELNTKMEEHKARIATASSSVELAKLKMEQENADKAKVDIFKQAKDLSDLAAWGVDEASPNASAARRRRLQGMLGGVTNPELRAILQGMASDDASDPQSADDARRQFMGSFGGLFPNAPLPAAEANQAAGQFRQAAISSEMGERVRAKIQEYEEANDSEAATAVAVLFALAPKVQSGQATREEQQQWAAASGIIFQRRQAGVL